MSSTTLRAALVLLFLSSGCGAPDDFTDGETGEEQDPVTFTSNHDYQLKSVQANKCLAVNSSGTLYFATCRTTSTSQKFRAQATTSQYFRVKMVENHRFIKIYPYFRLVASNGKCLMRSSASVVLATCATSGAFAWYSGEFENDRNLIGNFSGMSGSATIGGERLLHTSPEYYVPLVRNGTYFLSVKESGAPYASLQQHTEHLGGELWWSIKQL